MCISAGSWVRIAQAQDGGLVKVGNTDVSTWFATILIVDGGNIYRGVLDARLGVDGLDEGGERNV